MGISRGGAGRKEEQERRMEDVTKEERCVIKGKGEKEEDGEIERKQGREQKAAIRGKAEKRKRLEPREIQIERKVAAAGGKISGVIKSVGHGNRGEKALMCSHRHLILTKTPLVGKGKSQLCK